MVQFSFLQNIIGQEAGQSVIEEYLQRRGYTGLSSSTPNVQTSKFQAYMKPPSDTGLTIGTKRSIKAPKEKTFSTKNQDARIQTETKESKDINKVNSSVAKKKKAGKVISLAEAAKGSVVFQQGKPCSCQARRHKLISNCLSCGKIVCEQEGEGPCSFCGALVLREGSTYAGLDETSIPLSEAEAAAEAFAKKLVEYDRNSAARTSVIDDQSDYYEIEGNSWLSTEVFNCFLHPVLKRFPTKVPTFLHKLRKAPIFFIFVKTSQLSVKTVRKVTILSFFSSLKILWI